MIADSNNILARDSYVNGSFPEEPGLGFRHNEGANIVWVDGHVGWGDPYELHRTYSVGTGFRPYGPDGPEIMAKYWWASGR